MTPNEAPAAAGWTVYLFSEEMGFYLTHDGLSTEAMNLLVTQAAGWCDIQVEAEPHEA